LQEVQCILDSYSLKEKLYFSLKEFAQIRHFYPGSSVNRFPT